MYKCDLCGKREGEKVVYNLRYDEKISVCNECIDSNKDIISYCEEYNRYEINPRYFPLDDDLM